LNFEEIRSCDSVVLHMCLLDRSHSDAHRLDRYYWKTRAEVTRHASYMARATQV